MKRIILPLLFSSLSAISFAQETRNIVFYNVENLFDTVDDKKKNDNEFLPSADRKWNEERYNLKIAHINEVLDSIGNPLIAGFCEIENIKVVQDIIGYGNYKSYGIVHEESLDQRGIDNALIYDKEVLEYADQGIIRFDMPEPSSPSRDIVWGKFAVKSSGDTIMAFANHWPSRRGGQAESEPKRMIAALAAKAFIDSVLTANSKMNIVFMGDLNDHPENLAPQQVSGILSPMITEKSGEFGGTHNYRGEWGILDHIMVSPSFKKGKTRVVKKSGTIHSNPFLLTEYKGNTVPNRTYGGRKYLGGYSDHLPVSISINVK